MNSELILPAGPSYFPLQSGKYTVAPNLHPLGRDFGQGSFDKKSVSITDQYLRFRENKISAFLSRRKSHFLTNQFSEENKQSAILKLIEIIDTDLKPFIDVKKYNQKIYVNNNITGDKLVYDNQGKLQNSKVLDSDGIEVKELCYTNTSEKFNYSLDALVLQIQEDMAIVQRYPIEAEQPEGKYDQLVYLAVCGPSHWAPEEKIGKSFIQVHEPVPHNENLIKFSKAMIDTMVDKGPMVRFVWSFVTDNRINHHPDYGLNRNFDTTTKDPYYLRVEKQVIQSLTKNQLGLFFIGINFIKASTINENATMKQQLLSTLNSMSEQATAYKGIGNCSKELLNYLS